MRRLIQVKTIHCFPFTRPVSSLIKFPGVDCLGGPVNRVMAVKEEGWKARTDTVWQVGAGSFQQMLSFMFD